MSNELHNYAKLYAGDIDTFESRQMQAIDDTIAFLAANNVIHNYSSTQRHVLKFLRVLVMDSKTGGNRALEKGAVAQMQRFIEIKYESDCRITKEVANVLLVLYAIVSFSTFPGCAEYFSQPLINKLASFATISPLAQKILDLLCQRSTEEKAKQIKKAVSNARRRQWISLW